jgi:hypothetical protein
MRRYKRVGIYKKRLHLPLRQQLAMRHWLSYNWGSSATLFWNHPHQYHRA